MGSFWGDRSFEPKRQFRFLVDFDLGDMQLNFSAKGIDRPSYTIGEQSHQFFNHTFYYPGRITWNTVTLTLVDAITPGAADKLYGYLFDIGIQDPTGGTLESVTATTITKASATNALSAVKIREIGSLDPDKEGKAMLSGIQGEWELINPFITEVNFGAHSYDSDEMVEISVTLRFDWARYTGMSPASPVPSQGKHVKPCQSKINLLKYFKNTLYVL